MEWLIKQRMTFYRLALIFYMIALNTLFYSSANMLIISCATLGNALLILMMIGYSLFEKKRTAEKQARDERRSERQKKKESSTP